MIRPTFRGASSAKRADARRGRRKTGAVKGGGERGQEGKRLESSPGKIEAWEGRKGNCHQFGSHSREQKEKKEKGGDLLEFNRLRKRGKKREGLKARLGKKV